MNHTKLSGVIPPVATPLLSDGRVDAKRLSALATHLLSCGVHGLFANGSMGGFPFLTDLEQDRAIATVVETANGRVPVMAGLAELGGMRAVARAKQIASLGATHISMLAPIFYFTNQEQLVRYFSQIAAAVDLPVVLYDNPVLTKNPIHPETVMELRRKVPSLVGIKESNQDCINLQHLLKLAREEEGFAVLTGSEHLIVVGLQMGVDGTVGGLHNLHAKAAVNLYNAFRSGDIAGAEKHQQALVDLADIFSVAGIWDSFQDAMRYLGLAERMVGDPYLGSITQEQSMQVRKIMAKHVQPVAASLPPINSANLPQSSPSGPIEA